MTPERPELEPGTRPEVFRGRREGTRDGEEQEGGSEGAQTLAFTWSDVQSEAERDCVP